MAYRLSALLRNLSMANVCLEKSLLTLCNRFRDYLLHARQLKHTDKMVP